MNKQRERQQTNSINKLQRVSRKKKSTLSNIAEVQNENREKAFGFGYFDFVSEDLWEDSFSEIIGQNLTKISGENVVAKQRWQYRYCF